MNKTARTICCLYLFSLQLQAQIAPDAWLFAPATFSQTWSADNEEGIVERANFISFKALYFPVPRLAIGGQLQYNGYHASEPGFPLEKQISWWFMPTIRYYLSATDKGTQFFGETGASIFLNRHRFGSDLNSWGGIGGIGMDHFFNDHMALEVIAGYFSRKTRERTLTGRVKTYTQGEMNIQIALRLFLPSGPSVVELADDLKKARWSMSAWMDLDTDDDGVLSRHPFFLRGRIALFPAPLFALGFDGGVDVSGNNLFNLKVGASREGGFFARYYLAPTGNLQVFPHLGYSFSKNIYPGFYSSHARTFKAGLGINFRIDDRVALETLFQYRRHRFYTEDMDLIAIRQNSLGMELNLVYFVFAKKAGV